MKREHYATTQVDYYIYDLNDFKELRDRINNGTEASGTRYPNGTSGYEGKVFVLANDIDFANYAWEGIGKISPQRTFKGTINGNNCTISNFKTVNNTSNSNTTYFIHCQGATIQNLAIQGSYNLTANTQHCIFSSLGNSTFRCISFEVDVVNNMNMVYCIIGIDGDYCIDLFNFGNLTVGAPGYNGAGMLLIGGTVERCGNYGRISYNGSYSGGTRTSTMVRYRGYNNNLVIRNCINSGDLNNSLNANYGIAFGAKEITNTLYCGAFGNCSSVSGYISDVIPSIYSNNFYDNTKNILSFSGSYNGSGYSTSSIKSGNNIFNDANNWVYEVGYYPRLNNWLKNDPRVKI